MRKRTKITIDPKYILIACCVICFIFIIVSFKYEDKVEPIKTTVGEIMAPMQKGINSIGDYISDKSKIFTTMNQLIKENEELKEKLATVDYENKILQQDKYELETYRELYKLDQNYAEYPKVAANIISKDTNNWYNLFTIDKGTKHGLKVDMNVIAGNGLVGIIYDVGKNYAKVRSIIDDKSNVSGMILKTKTNCIVKGDLLSISEGIIPVELIDKDEKIQEGYEIVTSKESAKFLPGILIGYIGETTVDSSNMTMSGTLRPAVDFSSLDTVLIITQLKEELPKEAYQYND